MLVICCGMLRSGSTLQYQLAVAILEKTGRGSGLGDPRNVDCLELANANPSGMMQVLKVHKFQHLQHVEAAIDRRQAKCLYTYRDVRDVAVSLMNMRNIGFEELIFRNQEVQQSLSDFQAWTSFDDVLISRYEEMVSDIPQEVLRIAKHLNIELSTEDAIAIAENHSLDKQKQRIQQWKQGDDFNPRNHEAKSLLHHNHINSGRSQQWCETLTPIQIAYLESLTGTWLRDRGYSLSQPFLIQKASQILYSRYKLMGKLGRLQHHLQH
ncbi:MAG: sulfotransferase domain-containing protein, partial [Geitlerinemataceae cyanobacterium]